MINPKDVMRRLSVEELAETADEYYRAVSDPTPLMSKPFTFLHEAPQMLENFGLLLGGLNLGKTMTVLDFGGGTGWLSRFLCQLNCQAICCDVSPSALSIGRQLVEQHPLIGTAVYRPRFLLFDGHRLDLPDESLDRSVCFDAFHHIANQREVIAELGRVLRKGGIAGFSEPGRGHSQTPQSQYEMRNHRVLENDIDVNEIFGYAQAAGFTRIAIKALNDMSVSLDEYNRLFAPDGDGNLKSEIWNQTYNATHSRTIFFLHKGELVRDSRSHVGLAHRIEIEKKDHVIASGRRLRVVCRVVNTGEAWWLNTNSEIFGIVRLGSHLYRADGTLITIDHSRHDLPHPVFPGESIALSVDVDLPGPGSYRVAFDLVAEGVTWFENVGSQPVEVRVTVSA